MLDLDLPRIDRLVVQIGIEPEQRLRALLEDGDLQGEVAVAQQAAAMRTALVVGGRGFVGLGFRGFGRALAAGRKGGGQEEDGREADAPPGLIGAHQRRSALRFEDASAA